MAKNNDFSFKEFNPISLLKLIKKFNPGLIEKSFAGADRFAEYVGHKNSDNKDADKQGTDWRSLVEKLSSYAEYTGDKESSETRKL